MPEEGASGSIHLRVVVLPEGSDSLTGIGREKEELLMQETLGRDGGQAAHGNWSQRGVLQCVLCALLSPEFL